MSEVFIKNLIIENFGPFYGQTNFDFGTLEERCGILIGGKNGAGKTHLLRAIYLAVVGETGVHDLSNIEKMASDATRFRFEQSLNRKAASEGANKTRFEIEILHRDEPGGGAKKLTFARTITHRTNSSPRWESVALNHDGTVEKDDILIQRLRDSLLPRHLARFFFFDAERSQGLNLSDKDIVDGISRILGLWTYDDLAVDLRNLINNKIPQNYNSRALTDERMKLNGLIADITRFQGDIQAKSDEEQEIKERIRETESELTEVEEELRALGAVDPDELERTKHRREEIKKTKDQLEVELRTSWETALPIALLGNYRHVLHNYLLMEEKRNEWERSKATVEPKIPQIKADVFDDIPLGFVLEDEKKSFYEDRLENALRRIFYPPPKGMSDSVFVVDRIDVSAQIRQRLMQAIAAMKTLADLSSDIERKTAELRELDSWLRQRQQDLVVLAHSGELRERAKNLTSRIDNLQTQLEDVIREQKILESKITELKREEINQSRIVEKAQKGKDLSTLANRYREAAEEIRRNAAIQLRNTIGEQVGELWVEISERDREFIGMKFDDHWNCFLIRKDGKEVSWEEVNTSAGQRQVRVLAFYETLRRLARLVPPLVIDTPLGRLDKEVRKTVLENLYLRGHQSIILATNSEIDPDGPLYEQIKNQLARVYTLAPDGEPESPHYSVSVHNDYFGKIL